MLITNAVTFWIEVLSFIAENHLVFIGFMEWKREIVWFYIASLTEEIT